MGLMIRAERRLDRTAVLVTVGVFVLILVTAATAVGAAVFRYTNGGAVTAVRTATTTGATYATDQGTFTAVSGAQVQVKVGSTAHAVLIITFSAESSCQGSGACWIAAYVDGVQVTPAEVQFDIDSTSGLYQARSFQWVTNVLSGGTHSVVIAGKVDTSGTTFYMASRTLTVLRAKA